MCTIELLQNPFTYYEKELINIVSGQIAPSEIKDDILIAYEKGCNVFSKFVQQQLIWNKLNLVFHEKLWRWKLLVIFSKSIHTKKSI